MAALNFQTGDRPMQLNAARFLENGGCGYVLRPELTFSEGFVPGDPAAVAALAEPINVSIRCSVTRFFKRKIAILTKKIAPKVASLNVDFFIAFLYVSGVVSFSKFSKKLLFKKNQNTGEAKKMRKAKNGQLLNISPSKLQNSVKFEFFRLKQWGKVFQSMIVAPAKEAWFGRR